MRIQILKMIVAIWLVLSIFCSVWMYELDNRQQKSNYNVLYKYCSSRISMDYYDRFLYEKPKLNNGFMDFDAGEAYHFWLYSLIASGFISMIILVGDYNETKRKTS